MKVIEEFYGGVEQLKKDTQEKILECLYRSITPLVLSVNWK